MLSTIRRALTPSANQAEDRDLSNVSPDNSLAAPNLLIRDSSPPTFSPINSSTPETLPLAAQATNRNDSIMAEQHDLPMDLSSDQDSPDREQEATDDSLLGPVRASDPATESRPGAFSLDGASDDHLHIPEDDTQPRGSPMPSIELAQSTSKPQRASTPSVNYGLEARTSNTPQPSIILTKAKEKSLGPEKPERVASKSVAASVEPEQSAPAATDDTKTLTSSKVRAPKRKRDDDPSEIETKNAKKPRGQSKKEKGSSAPVKQQGTIEDASPKKRGRPKKEQGSTAAVKQQASTNDELPEKRVRSKKEEGSIGNLKEQAATNVDSPKRRGRPKKEEGSTPKVKLQRASKEDAPAKRGRPSKDAFPTSPLKSIQTTRRSGRTQEAAAPMGQDRTAKETPKKRGRPGKEMEPTRAVEPTSVPAADTPKKRGRPKKVEEAAQVTEPQVVSPSKRGKPSTNKPIADATTGPQGPKTRGRPKAAGRDDDAPKSKTKTPGKRGRPKKEHVAPKGAKPTGVVKKKAGRK